MNFSIRQLLRESPLSLGYALGFFGTTVMPVWVADMSALYGVAIGRVGLIASLELGCVAAATAWSASSRRTSANASTHTAVILSMISNLQAAYAPTLTTLTLLRAVAGLSHGFILAQVTRRAAQSPHPSRVFGMQMLALVAMAIVYFTLSPLLSALVGVGSTFLFYGAASALTLLSTLFLTPAESIAANAKPDRALRMRLPVMLSLIGATLLFCIQTSLWTYLRPAAATVGMSDASLSHLLALGAAVNLLAPVAAALLDERAGRTMPFLAGFAALGTAAVLVATDFGATAYGVGVVALSFSTIFLGPFVMAWLVQLDSSGRLAAAAPAFFVVGLAIGPALGGLILSIHGLSGLAVFGGLAAVTAFLLFAASIRAHGLQV